MKRPLFIWEPVPDLCVPSELDACRKALSYVDVISPNHAELCGSFGVEPHRDNGEIGEDILRHLKLIEAHTCSISNSRAMLSRIASMHDSESNSGQIR
jgi:hypothetical protein